MNVEIERAKIADLAKRIESCARRNGVSAARIRTEIAARPFDLRYPHIAMFIRSFGEERYQDATF